MAKLQVARSDLPSQHICFHIVLENVLHTPVPADMNPTQKLLRCCILLKCLSFSFCCLIYYLLYLHINKHFTFKSGNLDHILLKHLVLIPKKPSVKLDIEKLETYLEKVRSTVKWNHLHLGTTQWGKTCAVDKIPVLGLHLDGVKLNSSKPNLNS